MIESWRSIPDWPMYQVSNLGRVKRISGKDAGGRKWKGKIKQLTKKENGTMVVGLCGGAYRKNWQANVAWLVLLAFVGPRPIGMEACHYDDNQSNNSLTNLRWDTRLNNRRDAIRNGKIASAKLNDTVVRKILKEYKPRSSLRGRRKFYNKLETIKGSTHFLAKKYGVDESRIRAVVNGTAWTHVSG